jgi:hypothetical protein
MLTLPSVVPGQNSLTIHRLAFGFGAVPNADDAHVIAAMGDSEQQQVVGHGTYSPQAFLYVVNRLFPGHLKNPPADPGLMPDMSRNIPKPDERLTYYHLRDLFKSIATAASQIVAGMHVSSNIDASEEEAHCEIVRIGVDGDLNIVLYLKDATGREFTRKPSSIV